MQQCTDARPNCRSRHREPNGNRRETTRRRSDTIVDLRPTPRSLGGLSGYSTKPAGKEQAKTHEESAECLPKRQGGGSATPHAAGKPKAQKSITECTIPRRGVVQKNTYGLTPTPKEQSEQTKPEHHRQDRPTTTLPLDVQGGTKGGLEPADSLPPKSRQLNAPLPLLQEGVRGRPSFASFQSFASCFTTNTPSRPTTSISRDVLPRPVEHPHLAYDVLRWHVAPVTGVVRLIAVVAENEVLVWWNYHWET